MVTPPFVHLLSGINPRDLFAQDVFSSFYFHVCVLKVQQRLCDLAVPSTVEGCAQGESEAEEAHPSMPEDLEEAMMLT